MQKMRLAVGSLIDRVTLGRRLLEAAAEVLAAGMGGALPGRRAGHGRSSWWPATARRPTRRCLAADNPLVDPAAADADGPALARHGAERRVGPGHRRHDRARGRSGRRARRRRPSRRAAGARAQAQRHALRRRRDGVPGGAELGRHAGAALGRHPADAREPEPGAARQGREDRRAAAADPDPPGSAPGSGRARARRLGSLGRQADAAAAGRRPRRRPRASSTRSRARARPSAR